MVTPHVPPQAAVKVVRPVDAGYGGGAQKPPLAVLGIRGDRGDLSLAVLCAEGD